MVTIILVCTGTKYDEWYVNNIIHMIKNYGNLIYDEIQIIRKGEGNVYDKLQMFRDFTEERYYLYFDLDVVIKGDINHLIRKEFTTLFAWWRPELHTPINSSIMSWSGDNSYIYYDFHEDENYSRVKYWRGIDEYIYKETYCQLYEKVCWSCAYDAKELDYPVCLFNHGKDMKKIEWTQKYLLSE
tara:strand:- start:200 stop:754 length:555 start_codon:yes stop_codon:yes gene_type:complete